MREFYEKMDEKRDLENLKRLSIYNGETAILRILFCYILLRLSGWSIGGREREQIFSGLSLRPLT